MPSKQDPLSKASWFLNPNLCVFPGEWPQPDWSFQQASLSHPPPALQLVKAQPGPHITHTSPMQMHQSSTGFLDYSLVLFINVWYFFLVLPCMENGTQPVHHTAIIKSHHLVMMYSYTIRQVVIIFPPFSKVVLLFTFWS